MDKLDILNRDKFVEQLVRLIENISDNKTSTCFAINGAWGSGKSFVLDMFEEKLSVIQSEKTFNEKYFIVRYNCWKYDYYEEPLIAIVSSIIAEIDKKVTFFSNSKEKQEILGMFKATGTALLSIANEMVKSKVGVDFLGSYEKVKEGEKAGTEKYEKEHAYDTYLDLNRVIDKLSELLQNIAERYTVVIIVDELDRCVPDYAIKVLERLHHLTEEKKNIITVVAVDKKQLESSIKQLFGFENPSKYLEKFFNFEVELDKGEISEKITEKYADYINLFDGKLIPFPEPIDECIQSIFNGIEARRQEQLVKRTMLVHKLLYSDKKDYSFMCMELLLTVLICVHNDESCFSNNSIDVSSFARVFIPSIVLPPNKSFTPAFSKFFQSKFENIKFRKQVLALADGTEYFLPNTPNLYAAILHTWYHMHKINTQLVFIAPANAGYEPMKNNPEELKKFIETLRMIK